MPELEQRVNDFWKSDKIFEKSIEQRDLKNLYTFVDGPPFVTGSPHYGHLLTSIAKDMIPRYHAMNGKRVRRVFGWDCHGLPIEDKVNQLLGIKSSKQVEQEVGIENYVRECRKYVQDCTSDWRWYIEKIGRWVDMDNAYYTMNLDFMESVIWGFKQIYQKGLIYKGKRVSLYSTDTSTPVSNFEVAMDADNYRDVEDLSIFVKFELKKWPGKFATAGKKVFLLAWTTTPWSIPADFALAVNGKIKYVLVAYDKQLFILAKDRIEYAFGKPAKETSNKLADEVEILEQLDGTKLEGLEYVPIYDFFVKQANESDFKVYLSDEVVLTEGTGVLHIAPAYGEVDFQMGHKHGLSDFADIDSEGKLTVGAWQGVYLKEADSLIAEDLEKKGNLLRSQVYTHRVPFYRGQNALIYMAQDAYFIDIQKIKARMLELNGQINWIPKHIKNGRSKETIETSPDWCISRNRYWATIMPIWKSDDGDEIVIGSLKELTEYCDKVTKKNVDGRDKYFFEGKEMDLHRDTCDKIVLTKGEKKYHRVSEVLDVWMDSGSAPFAEYHYPFENKELFENSRPADFIVEYVPQVRAWFNMLLRVSTILFDENAFKTAVCHGTIAGSDGRKMSKSFGNYPDPKMLIDKYGGDALRLYLMSSPVMKGEDMNFSEEGLVENYRVLLIFWNSYKFFVDYAQVFGWKCEDLDPQRLQTDLTVLDKWVLAKLTDLVIKLKQAFDDYDFAGVSTLLKSFIVDDFSTWYIRRSRDRVGLDSEVGDRDITLSVMYGVLVTLTKLMAPLTPFITEEIFQNLTGDVSVHLTDYPLGDKSLLNDSLIQDMKVVRQIVELGHSKRKEANIKLRQPLSRVVYTSTVKLSDQLEKIAKEELNVKNIEHKKGSDEKLSVELDTKITPLLESEGQARELIRQIQQMRKDKGLTLADKLAKIEVPDWPKDFEEMILKSTGAKAIEKAEGLSITKAD